MVQRRALRGIKLVVTRLGLAAPGREAAHAPEEVRVVGVERDIERHGGGDIDQHLIAVRHAVIVPHHHVVLAALRHGRVEEAQRRRIRAEDVPAVGNVLALEAPLVKERRGAERLDGERDRRAGHHVLARGLRENDRHGGRAVRHEVHFVEPRAVEAGDDVRVFHVAPAQRNRAGRQVEGKFLPVLLAGNLRPLCAADRKGQPVRIRLRRNLPPETNRAGSRHDGLQRRLIGVTNRAALRRRLAIMGNVRLHEPAVRGREPLEIGRVHGLGERERRNDFDEDVRADGHAGDVADDHGVEAGLLRLRVAERKSSGVRAEHARAVRDIQAVALPAIGERKRAGRAHGQRDRHALRHALRRRLHDDAWRHEDRERRVGTHAHAHGVRD